MMLLSILLKKSNKTLKICTILGLIGLFLIPLTIQISLGDQTNINKSEIKNITSQESASQSISVSSHVYSLNDNDTFNVWVGDSGTQEIVATCKNVSKESYVFIQDGIDANQNAKEIGAFIDNDILPIIVDNFAPPSDIDGNGKIVVLYANLAIGIGGYFSSGDLTVGGYNGEIVYLSAGLSTRSSLGTLIHELQHLVHHTVFPDDTEMRWFNEGCSKFSETLFSLITLDSEFIATYVPTGVSLNYWDYEGASANTDYQIAHAFTTYLWDQYGSGNLSAIYQTHDGETKLNGIDGVMFVLNQYFPDLTFERLFLNWLIASIVDKGYTGDVREYYYEQAEVSVYPIRFPSSGGYTSSAYPYDSTLTLLPWLSNIYHFRYFDPQDPINITIEVPLDSQDHLFGINIVREIELNDSFEYLIDSFMLTETNISAGYHATFNAVEEGFSNLYITVSHLDGGEGFYWDIPESEKDVKISLLVEATSTIATTTNTSTTTTKRASQTGFDISLFYLILLSFSVFIIKRRLKK